MRPLKAYINLENLKSNYQFLRNLHGGRALAVIKADAYGHGAIDCATALQPIVDGFAVAFLEEALELRKAAIEKPILMLEGVFNPEEYFAIDEQQLMFVILNKQQYIWFKEHPWQHQVTVWLKIDSGMHRGGFCLDDYKLIYRDLCSHAVVKEIINISHFANADNLESNDTSSQFNYFQIATQDNQSANSICNSAGVLYHHPFRQQWARVGLALYGIDPIIENPFHSKLKPVMSLHSKIFAEKVLKKGEKIGYGGIFTAPKDLRVGLVACGYADGYPRLPSQDNPVIVAGERSRILGRVSMDMLSVELNKVHQGVGSEVELWGKNISINDIALRANTIPYEIFCHLKRAQKIYIDS